MQLEINKEERDLLTEFLRREYQDLREEIYKTEGFKFKSELKRRENAVESLLRKIAPEELKKTA